MITYPNAADVSVKWGGYGIADICEARGIGRLYDSAKNYPWTDVTVNASVI